MYVSLSNTNGSVNSGMLVKDLLSKSRKAHSYFDNAQLRCVFGFYENDSLVSYGVSNPG